MAFLQTWRWYGPDDPVSLADIRQAGAQGVVTALHHVANGEVWPMEEIEKRKAQLERFDLTWSVVESLPIHEAIKLRSGAFERYLANYQQSMLNLAHCGVRTICYNFMPVLDWTRTDLAFQTPDGSLALRFDYTDLAVFDIYVLDRPNAKNSYPAETLSAAEIRHQEMTEQALEQLQRNILAGLPGSEEGYELDTFRSMLNNYQGVDAGTLTKNLQLFLEQIIPVAVEAGLKMAIHPDDPPFSLFGLPRIVSDANDLETLLSSVNNSANGLTFCSGSLGVIPHNDLVNIIERFADRIHFVHLRNVQREGAGSFHEANHLEGSTDMYELVKAFVQHKKETVPMRPDHGHQMLDDLGKQVNPGYSAIGRLRGLAELRGLEMGIAKTLTHD